MAGYNNNMRSDFSWTVISNPECYGSECTPEQAEDFASKIISKFHELTGVLNLEGISDITWIPETSTVISEGRFLEDDEIERLESILEQVKESVF